MKFQKHNTKKNRKPLTIKTKYHEHYWWAIPIIPFFEAWSAYTKWNYNRMKWDEAKATKVLNVILSKKMEYVPEDKAFYYCMDWGCWYLWRLAPRKYRKWARKFSGDLHDFIEVGYENPDYIKSIEVNNYNERWIKFEERA